MHAPSTIRLLILCCAASALACGAAERNLQLVDPPMLGHRAARNEVVVFSDFQCPFCARTAEELNRLHAALPNRFNVYFKHFPLPQHPAARMAAQAAEAARLQGRFREMHDLLFRHGSRLDESLIVACAEKLQLDMARFRRDLDSPAVAQKVAADVAEGERLGVNGTPYLFINRQPFLGSFADLRRVLR